MSNSFLIVCRDRKRIGHVYSIMKNYMLKNNQCSLHSVNPNYRLLSSNGDSFRFTATTFSDATTRGLHIDYIILDDDITIRDVGTDMYMSLKGNKNAREDRIKTLNLESLLK